MAVKTQDIAAAVNANGAKGVDPTSDATQLAISTIRCLAADIVQAYKGGHAGTVMGAAPILVSLYKDIMSFNPKNPLWLNRDRFVLSAGHACLFQYLGLHLTGHDAWTLDEIKQYHSRNFIGSKAAGHPEIEQDIGIEVTTGPLGQGIANAVGLAIASKQLAAQFNKSDAEIVTNTIWCFTGDGCIQEGVGQEAISVAGHLGLDNLVLVYDRNRITVDGSIHNCFTEDVPARFVAADWKVFEVALTDYASGKDQVAAISAALNAAKAYQGQPCLVVVDTVIGFGSRKANTGPAHGQALGDVEVAYVKTQFGFDPEAKFQIPAEVYAYFGTAITKGAALETEWNGQLAAYKTRYPDELAELERRVSGKLPQGWRDLLPAKSALPQAPQPTRKSSGIVVETLAPLFNDFVAGSADLLESTFVSWKGMTEFQKPSSGLGDYAGRQLRYGIREHSMAAIANGLAAYLPQHTGRDGGGFLPIYSTFFMFCGYALPAIRMAALQKLRTVAVATHDSIGIGEDGPTHQPIALAAFFRALPGVRLWRPADAEEVMGAWEDAIGNGEGPSLLCLSRQPLPLLPGSCRTKALKGAYVVRDDKVAPSLTLIATGSEVSLACDIADRLSASPFNISTRVVSAPCLSHFDAQTREYKASVLPSQTSLVIAIEAWSSFGWARYAHASLSMSTFGLSGPQADLFEHFGFSVDTVTTRIVDFIKRRTGEDGRITIPGVGEFEDLLEGFASVHH